MNALAWTAVITIALFITSGLLFALVWLLERLEHAAARTCAYLGNHAAQFLLCCAIGALAAIFYFLGLRREIEADQAPEIAATSNR